MIKNFKWLLFASLSFVACSDDDTTSPIAEEPITAGTADFSKYIALGNSLTAGFSDNALFRTGQENSYPNILSQQFALAGGGTFAIPYVNGNTGGLLFGGTPIQGTRLYLNGFLSATAPNIMPVPGPPTTDILDHLTGPFSNMG
ncbi:MAG TPA: G-D-S-L family lipolytic protein, partial [Flavobacterium sp.]|nr:G-D-S-L family lipolytic protein [Flavobacterium sp.]